LEILASRVEVDICGITTYIWKDEKKSYYMKKLWQVGTKENGGE
jgi:hypothetical protein